MSRQEACNRRGWHTSAVPGGRALCRGAVQPGVRVTESASRPEAAGLRATEYSLRLSLPSSLLSLRHTRNRRNRRRGGGLPQQNSTGGEKPLPLLRTPSGGPPSPAPPGLCASCASCASCALGGSTRMCTAPTTVEFPLHRANASRPHCYTVATCFGYNASLQHGGVNTLLHGCRMWRFRHGVGLGNPEARRVPPKVAGGNETQIYRVAFEGCIYAAEA